MGRVMVVIVGREIKGSKPMESFEGQDKEFVLDSGVYWKPVKGDEKRGRIMV